MSPTSHSRNRRLGTTFKINRVYTRSGDDGKTGLVGGERVLKTDSRVAAYGDIDELNSFIGLTRSGLDSHDPLNALLLDLQQELFDLGSELATQEAYPNMWRTEPRHVARLEKLCDQYGDGLPELTSFIVPGGEKVAALFHVLRTVARRAERSLVELAGREGPSFNYETVKYVNRLSDLFFILSRDRLRTCGVQQPVWIKEGERKTT